MWQASATTNGKILPDMAVLCHEVLERFDYPRIAAQIPLTLCYHQSILGLTVALTVSLHMVQHHSVCSGEGRRGGKLLIPRISFTVNTLIV